MVNDDMGDDTQDVLMLQFPRQAERVVNKCRDQRVEIRRRHAQSGHRNLTRRHEVLRSGQCERKQHLPKRTQKVALPRPNVFALGMDVYY